MRDDFLSKIKDVLAQRVGMRCSNPACCRPTSGPRSNPSKAINIGVAAHITAASAGGPRHDPSLTLEDRRSPENGIWLCQSCAKLIDNDVQHFSKEKLIEWKRHAENRARQNIESPATNEEREKLLSGLEQLLNNNTQKQEKGDEGVTYGLMLTPGTDHIDPKPNILYSRTMQTGQKINYMVRNKLLMCEIVFPDGKSLIADIGIGKVEIHKLPYPLDEMTIEVDPSHIIKEETNYLENGNRLVKKIGKWGFCVQILYNSDGKPLRFAQDFGQISITEPFKKLIVTPNTNSTE